MVKKYYMKIKYQFIQKLILKILILVSHIQHLKKVIYFKIILKIFFQVLKILIQVHIILQIEQNLFLKKILKIILY